VWVPLIPPDGKCIPPTGCNLGPTSTTILLRVRGTSHQMPKQVTSTLSPHAPLRRRRQNPNPSPELSSSSSSSILLRFGDPGERDGVGGRGGQDQGRHSSHHHTWRRRPSARVRMSRAPATRYSPSASRSSLGASPGECELDISMKTFPFPGPLFFLALLNHFCFMFYTGHALLLLRLSD
jgi:hypothetical protein